MAKRKTTRKSKEQLTIAGIIFCVVICAVCVLTDVGEGFSKVDFNIEETPIGEIVNDVAKLGEVLDEDTINEIKEEFDSAVKNEQNGESVTTKETPVVVSDRITGTVVRVVDGDTYVLNIDGEETKVRLIGVDTPESVAPSDYRKDNTEEGKEVSDIVKDKITAGTTLYVEYDVSPTDKYGRHLAYLYFEDGTMVQDWLLNNGYANIATYPPNVKYVDHFKELAHKAYENKVGLWNGFFEYEA